MIRVKQRWHILLLVLVMLAAAALACDVGTGGSKSGDTGPGEGGVFQEDEETPEPEETEAPDTGGDEATDAPTDEPTDVPTEEAATEPPPPPGNAITTSNAGNVAVLRTLSPGGGQNTALTSVAFAPDSIHVATYGWSKIVTIWDLSTGKIANQLSGPTDYGLGLDFSEDGSKLAAGGADYRLHVWNTDGWSKVATINSGVWANRVSLSPDGSKVAVAGTSSSSVKIFDANNGSELGSIKPTGTILWSTEWSPDGKYIAAGTDGGGAYVYDAQNFSLVAQLQPTFTDQITDIEFSPDGKYVVVGFDEGDIGVWTVDGWSRVTSAKALSATFSMAGLMDTSFGVNGDVIFAGGGEGKVVILAADGGGTLKELQLPNPIWALDVSGDGSKVAVAMDNGDLIIIGLPGS